MLQSLRDAAAGSLVERDREVEALILGLVAREHVLFVGGYGTAKSAVCRAVAAGVGGARFQERAMSPTTAPEDLFGPPSIKALREDRRVHAGGIQDAELVFLDEWPRGGDSIRDALLPFLGPERQCLVGTEQVRVPLVSCCAAANTWTDTGWNAASLDRWSIRRTVRPVSDAATERLLFADLPQPVPVVQLADVVAAGDRAAALPIGTEAREALLQTLVELQGEGIVPSDRRKRLSVKIARAAAVIAGSIQVEPEHLECLADVLWDQQEQASACAGVVLRVANPAAAKVEALLAAAEEIRGTDPGSWLEAGYKLKDLTAQAKALGGTRAIRAAQHLAERARLAMRCAVGPGGDAL